MTDPAASPLGPGRFARAYAAALVVFLAIDAVWLGVVARDFFATRLAHLLRPEVDYLAALAFYALFVAGIVHFGTRPGVARGSARVAAVNGGFLGALAYAAYDLTNLATLPDWPLAVVVVDITWGALLSAVSAVAGWWVARR